MAAMRTKKRKELITKALREFGGQATTHLIAVAVGLNVNGVSQTLGTMENVEEVDPPPGSRDRTFKLKEDASLSRKSA